MKKWIPTRVSLNWLPRWLWLAILLALFVLRPFDWWQVLFGGLLFSGLFSFLLEDELDTWQRGVMAIGSFFVGASLGGIFTIWSSLP